MRIRDIINVCGEGEKIGETQKTRHNAFCTNTFDPSLYIKLLDIRDLYLFNHLPTSLIFNTLYTTFWYLKEFIYVLVYSLLVF